MPYPINLTPTFGEKQVISGRFKVDLVKRDAQDLENSETYFYRADSFQNLVNHFNGITGKSRIIKSVELVGVYYYDLYFDLTVKAIELPFDLTVFLYCIY